MKKDKNLLVSSTLLNLNLLYAPKYTLSSKNFVENIGNSFITDMSNKKISSIEYNIKLSNAGNLNISLIPNNVENETEINLNQNLHISKGKLVYGKDDNIESCIFKLQNDSKNIGYVIVSGNSVSKLTPKIIYKLLISIFN